MKSITDRIDRITDIPPAYRKIECPPPKSVKIELTSRCDLRCYFCATSKNMRKKNDMNFQFLQGILAEMREVGVEEIGLFYLGESMLYELLPEVIEFCQVLKYPYVFLTTNGRKATYDRVYKCAEAGLDSLKFSFNSHDRASYKDTTRIDGFKDVVKNIRDARLAVDRVYKQTGHL